MPSGSPRTVPGGRPRQIALAGAGALAVIGALLPWVAAPLGFRQLQTRGVDGAFGRWVLAVGVLLLLDAAVSLVRRRAPLGSWPTVLVGALLALLAARGWADAHDVLEREVPGIGVHPGQRGPGLVVLWFAVAAAAIGALLAVRDGGSAPGAGSPERHGPDHE